jgi:hypothetical protein
VISGPETLEQVDVAQLRQLVRGPRGQPGAQRLAAARGDAVRLAPATALFARLGQVPGVREPLGLGVQLRVLQRPQIADADRDHGLQLVGSRAGNLREQSDAEDPQRDFGCARLPARLPEPRPGADAGVLAENPSSCPLPAPTGKTPECCSRSCSIRPSAHRSSSSSTLPRSVRSPVPESRITFPSVSTAASSLSRTEARQNRWFLGTVSGADQRVAFGSGFWTRHAATAGRTG